MTQPKLTVVFTAMPESNGKSNWTAFLCRVGEDGKPNIFDGFQFERSEYTDRVRYAADEMRFLIGEIDKRPFILDYDSELQQSVHPLKGADGDENDARSDF